MAEQKKACVVRVAGDSSDVSSVVARLEAEGFAVSVCAVSAVEATAIEAGETGALPAEVQGCLAGAELVVVLVTEALSGCGGVGVLLADLQNTGVRIVGVWSGAGAGASAPQIIDDYSDSLVNVGSDAFADAICGGEVWEAPTGEAAPPPDKEHQICQ